MKKHRYSFLKKIIYFLKRFFKKQFLSFMMHNEHIMFKIKQRVANKLSKHYKKGSFTKLKKYCSITGRLRFNSTSSVYSRITIREVARLTYLLGIRRNSR